MEEIQDEYVRIQAFCDLGEFFHYLSDKNLLLCSPECRMGLYLWFTNLTIVMPIHESAPDPIRDIINLDKNLSVIYPEYFV